MKAWLHAAARGNTWEHWSHIKFEVTVVKVTDPTLYIWAIPVENRGVGYYIGGKFNEYDAEKATVLPLDMPIEDVLAAAEVIARLE